MFYRNSYRGKILRLDVDNRDPDKEYAVPPDNPFIENSNALPEIYSYGWRMPWRCSVDPGDPKTGEGAGRVFCTDVGTNIKEEVNLLVKGGNYGWPIFEGDVCLVDNQTCDAGQCVCVCMCVCVCVCVYKYTCICAYVSVCVFTHLHLHIHMFINPPCAVRVTVVVLCVCVCVCVCVRSFLPPHTSRP